MIIIVFRNFICLIGLIFISPLLIISSLLLFLEDGLPFFFKQERVGLDGKLFIIYKIRTMRKNSPQVGTHILGEKFTLKIGKIIRKIKLDEFPQLINVIKGDLNLIGPRPGLPNQEDLYNARLKKNIFNMKPGISGLSQVLGYDMSHPNKLAEIDGIYMQYRSLYLDFIILVATFFESPRKYLRRKFKI
jgi:O-antigen biosynthesis protein WbqP